MDKVSVVDSFGRVAEEINNTPINPNALVDYMYYAYSLLPNLVVMPATSAANCGVTDNFLKVYPRGV